MVSSFPDALPLSELDLNFGGENSEVGLGGHHGVGQVQLKAVLRTWSTVID